MQVTFDVFPTATDPEFVAHVNNVKTSRGLGLLPSLTVESMLDNVEEFYNSKTKAGKWAKTTDEGGMAKSHIPPQHPYSCIPHSESCGRGCGCGGRGRGCGRGGHKNTKSKSWAPKPGESHVKVINGLTHMWCGYCADYKHDHGTEENADKCPHYKPNSRKGRDQAAKVAALRATTEGGSPNAPVESPQAPIPMQPQHTPTPANREQHAGGTTPTGPAGMLNSPATPATQSGLPGLIWWSGAGF
eukprot:2931064-Ditylum_brightwellii.AAC.1